MKRLGVSTVDGVSTGIPIASKISAMWRSNRSHCSGMICRGRTAAHSHPCSVLLRDGASTSNEVSTGVCLESVMASLHAWPRCRRCRAAPCCTRARASVRCSMQWYRGLQLDPTVDLAHREDRLAEGGRPAPDFATGEAEP